METSELLRAYLSLESEMLTSDKAGDETWADQLRNEMDEIWYKLSEADRGSLDKR